MSMTHKEFEAVSTTLKNALQLGELAEDESVRRAHVSMVTLIARDLSVVFAESNPHFDRSKFLAACGINN